MKWSDQALKLRAQAIRRVSQDRQVPHGAFRLFYLLANQYANEAGRCWPGRRALQKIMHCSNRSLGGWVTVLRSLKHLTTKTISTNTGTATLYTLWSLDPQTEPPGGSAFSRGGSPLATAGSTLIEGGSSLSGGGSKSGTETTYYKHSTINQGGTPGEVARAVSNVPLTPAAIVTLQKELERIEARIQAIRNAGSEVAGGGILYSEKQKEERKRLLARKEEIKQTLGWLA